MNEPWMQWTQLGKFYNEAKHAYVIACVRSKSQSILNASCGWLSALKWIGLKKLGELIRLVTLPTANYTTPDDLVFKTLRRSISCDVVYIFANLVKELCR